MMLRHEIFPVITIIVTFPPIYYNIIIAQKKEYLEVQLCTKLAEKTVASLNEIRLNPFDTG